MSTQDHEARHARDDVSSAELGRMLKRIEVWMQRLDTRIDQLKAERLPARMNALEQWQTDVNAYAVRLVIGIAVASAAAVGGIAVAVTLGVFGM